MTEPTCPSIPVAIHKIEMELRSLHEWRINMDQIRREDLARKTDVRMAMFVAVLGFLTAVLTAIFVMYVNKAGGPP